MQKYKILSSSSAGNAVVYFDELLVDVGLNYKSLEPHLKDINIILLTHRHSDHFSPMTVSLIARERPDIFWIVPKHLYHEVEMLNLSNLYVVEPNIKYKIKDYRIESFELYHDVPNVGYKISKKGYKIIHATDTVKIDHIEAKGYDLYAIEHNYDEEELNLRILEKAKEGVFIYEVRSKDTHLSFQKAEDWINSQKKETSEVVKLHISSHYVEKEDSENT